MRDVAGVMPPARTAAATAHLRAVLSRCALACWLAGAAAAQDGPAVSGILRTQDLQPARHANVSFQPAPLARLEALGPWQAQPEPLQGKADARGEFRIPCPQAPGLLTAWTESGLAAMTAPVHPGDPVRLELVPSARVRAPEGEPTTFWLSVHGIDAFGWHRRAAANVLVLAAGEHEAWSLRNGIAHWQRLRLLPGETVALPSAREGRRIAGDGSHRIVVADRPEVELLGPQAGAVVLVGEAAEAPLAQVWPDGRITTMGAASAATIVRSHCVEVRDAADQPVAGATIWLTTERAGGSHRVAACVQTDASGAATVPVASDLADTWLVVESEGRAPVARALAATVEHLRVRVEPPVARAIRVLRPDGSPAAGTDLRVLDASLASASAMRVTTDLRGWAHVPLAPAMVVVAAVDARYACDGLVLGPDDVQTELQLAAGQRLRGRAVVADDQPAAGALVTLRDPSGRLLPRERTVRADASGWFEFTGLPTGRQLVLFAQQQRGGRTWSGKLVRAVADEGTWTIELRDEDPVLPGHVK